MKIKTLIFCILSSLLFFTFTFSNPVLHSDLSNEKPKEIYGDKKSEIMIKISNGGAGPTGILRALAEDYLSFNSKKNMAIAWYQNISMNSLKLLKEKKVDISLIYEPIEAKKAVDENMASNLTTIFNDHFLIVGPNSNVANLHNNDSAANSFGKISNYAENNLNKRLFLSRNDSSGTNVKEKQLWKLIQKEPYSDNNDWYVKYTVFPEDALLKADMEGLYTITDWGTWLKSSNNLKNSKIYIQGEYDLLNPCIAILQKQPKSEAVEFLNYLKGDRAQKIIREFGKDTYNGRAFFTEAKQTDF